MWKFIVKLLMKRQYRLAPVRRQLPRSLVVMQDKENAMSGLADRLKLIIGAYHIAKQAGCQFKIYCEGAFDWNRYFEPAGAVNWTCSREELSFCFPQACPISLPLQAEKLPIFANEYHVYGAEDGIYAVAYMVSSEEWSALFHELFRPTEHTLQLLRRESLEPKSYVAIHTRFLNSLEQREEECYGVPIPAEGQEQLVSSVLKVIRSIREQYRNGVRIILMGDSEKFNNIARGALDGVEVVSTDVGHIAHSSAESVHDSAMKDFLLLSQACRVYSIVLPHMYVSSFSKFAARAGGVEYCPINAEGELPEPAVVFNSRSVD